MLSCSNWVTPINDAAALRAYGDNVRPSRALPEAPNRCRVNEGWSPRRVLKHPTRSLFEAKVNARWSLDFIHDSTRLHLFPHCQHRPTTLMEKRGIKLDLKDRCTTLHETAAC